MTVAGTAEDQQPKAYSYVRFSTPEQAEGDSFRRQTEQARAYAQRHGLDLDQTLTYQDLGRSGFDGSNAQRGALRAFRFAVPEFLLEGSPEFEERCANAWDRVIAKYAWTAQSRGIVLRNNPLKLPPYKDYVFDRMMKVEHAFKYR